MIPANHPTRLLRLTGGDLDGITLTADIDVGSRIDCGTGAWSARHVYVVTSDVVRGPGGGLESVAIPAVF